MSGKISPRIPAALSPFLPMLEQMSDGVQIFDAQKRLIYANETAAQNLGFSSPQVLLKACQEQLCALEMLSLCDATGRVLEASEYPCVQAFQGKAGAEKIVHFVDQQQRDRTLAIWSLPLRDETGTVQYGAVMSRDLTDLQVITQAVEQTTQQLHQIAAVLPSLVASLDQRECHVYANQAYLKAFRVAAESIQGQHLQAVVGPVVYQQLHTALAQAYQGEAADLCLPIGDRQARLPYQRVSIIPQYAGSSVVGVYVVLSDVAAHKHTTHVLQTETNFFRHSLEAAAVGTWDWHFADQEIMWSPPQEQLFGLSPGSFDGHPETFMQLVDEGDRATLKAAIEQAIQPRQQFAAEFRVGLPDGTTRWLSQRGQVLRDPDGSVMRMVGVTFDITAQRAAQEQLVYQMRRDRLIAKLCQDISRTDHIEQALPTIFEAIREHLTLDRLVLIDLRESVGKVIAEAQVPEVESMLDWQMRHPWSVKAAYLEKFQLGHPIGISDIHQQSFSASELSFLGFFNVVADLSIPLREDDQLWGLLSAQSQQPRIWSPEEKRLLETIGTLVSSAIQRDRLHHYLTRANRKLKRFAYLDGLTRVANRRRFEHFLNQEWRRLMREQSPMALIMVDIDYFKAFNDIYGHQAGDDCLRRIAGILRSAIQRPADIVARYGGEEFAIVLPNTDVEGAETIAERIRVLTHRAKIPHAGSSISKFVTLSSGIGVMYPHPLKAPDDLVTIADRALYQAKEDGRDRSVAFPTKSSSR